jgi:hypothetical protein
MIEIKVERVPVPCPACKDLAEDAVSAACTRCRRIFHSSCWAEKGCTVCPPLAAPAPESAPVTEPEVKHHGHTIPKGEEPRWLDKAENVKALAKGVYVVCGLLIVVEILGSLGIGYHKHGHESIGTDSWPAFYPLAGFIAYSLVVVLGMGLQKLVMRKEGYYDDE